MGSQANQLFPTHLRTGWTSWRPAATNSSADRNAVSWRVERDLIQKVQRNPMLRAFRVDKLTYAALEATLLEYVSGSPEAIPIHRMLSIRPEELMQRCQQIAAQASVHATRHRRGPRQTALWAEELRRKPLCRVAPWRCATHPCGPKSSRPLYTGSSRPSLRASMTTPCTSTCGPFILAPIPFCSLCSLNFDRGFCMPQ